MAAPPTRTAATSHFESVRILALAKEFTKTRGRPGLSGELRDLLTVAGTTPRPSEFWWNDWLGHKIGFLQRYNATQQLLELTTPPLPATLRRVARRFGATLAFTKP